MDQAWKEAGLKAWEQLNQTEHDPTQYEDDNEVRNLYLEDWLGDLGYDVSLFKSDYFYARRSVLREWLRVYGYDPDLVISPDGIAVDAHNRRTWTAYSLTTCLRLWLDEQGVNVSKIKDADIPGEAKNTRLILVFPSQPLASRLCAMGRPVILMIDR